MTGGKIVGFRGRCCWYLDAIGIYLKPAVEKVSSNANVMVQSSSYYTTGTEKIGHSIVQGSVGENYDIVLAARQKDSFGYSLPIAISKPDDSFSKPLPIEVSKQKKSSSSSDSTDVQKDKKHGNAKVPPKVEGATTHGPWCGTGGSVFNDGTSTGIRQMNLSSRNVLYR